MKRKKKIRLNETNLSTLCEAIKNDLEKRKYSAVTISHFKTASKELQIYAQERGIKDFSHSQESSPVVFAINIIIENSITLGQNIKKLYGSVLPLIMQGKPVAHQSKYLKTF